MSSQATRTLRRQEADRAYDIQLRAGRVGAAKYTAIGTALATATHYTWPTFRRQTLPFKAFLVSAFTIFGLVIGADNALLSHENGQRKVDADLRRQARHDIAQRGLVATETEIAKWKEERLKAQAQPGPSPS